MIPTVKAKDQREEPEAMDEENTFLTNIVESNYINTQESVLPRIQKA